MLQFTIYNSNGICLSHFIQLSNIFIKLVHSVSFTFPTYIFKFERIRILKLRLSTITRWLILWVITKVWYIIVPKWYKRVGARGRGTLLRILAFFCLTYQWGCTSPRNHCSRIQFEFLQCLPSRSFPLSRCRGYRHFSNIRSGVDLSVLESIVALPHPAHSATHHAELQPYILANIGAHDATESSSQPLPNQAPYTGRRDIL